MLDYFSHIMHDRMRRYPSTSRDRPVSCSVVVKEVK